MHVLGHDVKMFQPKQERTFYDAWLKIEKGLFASRWKWHFFETKDQIDVLSQSTKHWLMQKSHLERLCSERNI